MDRPFDDHAAPEVHKSAVLGKCHVQRGKAQRRAVASRVFVSPEVLFDQARLRRQCLRQRCNCYCSARQGRQLRRKVPIEEDQPAAGAFHLHVFDGGPHLPFFGKCGIRRSRAKRGIRDGGNIGEPPVFLMRGGETDLTEAGEGLAAKLAQPRQLASGGTLFTFGEVLQILRRGFCRRSHSITLSSLDTAGAPFNPLLVEWGCLFTPETTHSSKRGLSGPSIMPPRCRPLTPRSRSLPAPAPAPCRRSARCGHPSAHARSRALCSSAAAGNALPRALPAPGCAWRSHPWLQFAVHRCPGPSPSHPGSPAAAASRPSAGSRCASFRHRRSL